MSMIFHLDFTALKVHGKGDKERMVPITRSVRRMLGEYSARLKGEYLQKWRKSVIFNREGTAYLADYGLPYRQERIGRCRGAGQEQPARSEAYLCDASDGQGRRHARDTGVDGPLVAEDDAGVHPQQHCETETGIFAGAPPRAWRRLRPAGARGAYWKPGMTMPVYY